MGVEWLYKMVELTLLLVLLVLLVRMVVKVFILPVLQERRPTMNG
jgi:hypothetical protein